MMLHKVLPLFLLLLLFGCGGNNVAPRLPEVPVSEQINVTSLQYPMLRQDGGYAYLQAGYRGIVVIRQNAGAYLAFERACTYDPACTVEVDQSNLFLLDKCCGSQFNFQGNVMAGPALYGLKQYRTSLAGSILYITN